jgi:outer membrane protein insertion porin family
MEWVWAVGPAPPQAATTPVKENRLGMKLSKRAQPRLSSYLIASTLTAGLSLVSGSSDAQALQSLAAELAKSPTAGSPTAQNSTQVARGPVITDFVVIGNKTLSKTFIVLASGAHVGDHYTDQLQADMVAKLYGTGYFGANLADPEVDAVKVHSEAPDPPNGTCKVVIEVEENATIQNITLTGTGPIKPEEVLPLLHFTKGAVYSPVKFNRDVLDIQNLYDKRGYVVTIGQDVEIDPKGVFHVPLVVTRVSEIKLVGLHKTRRYVITREMQTKVGDYLNTNTVIQDRIRLLNLDLFDDVNISTFSAGAGLVGVTINLVEKRTGTVTAGVGYSDRAQLIGFAEVAETNFRGSGEAVTLRAETGGVAGRASVELGFNEPFLDRRHTALNVQLYDKTVYRFSNDLYAITGSPSTSTTSRRYNEQRVGTTLTVSRPVQRSLRASLSLRAENVMTEPLALPVQDVQILQNGPIYVFGAGLLHDTRDLTLDPASGGFQQFSFDVGHADLSPPRLVTGQTVPGTYGSVNFVKPYLESRQYISLSGRRPKNNPTKDETVFAFRGILGASAGTLPFFEQFFVGGGDNLRGYRDDRFWGKYLFLASAEFRQPLAPKFKGVIFVDVGDAWGGSYSQVQLNGFRQSGFQPHVGVGLGVRVVTPIGPLRLDYGIGDEGGRMHFSIGPTF